VGQRFRYRCLQPKRVAFGKQIHGRVFDKSRYPFIRESSKDIWMLVKGENGLHSSSTGELWLEVAFLTGSKFQKN